MTPTRGQKSFPPRRVRCRAIRSSQWVLAAPADWLLACRTAVAPGGEFMAWRIGIDIGGTFTDVALV
ncbi:MAG: hypothetical protein AAF334_03295, partial [Pseudomonadota bacterium]